MAEYPHIERTISKKVIINYIKKNLSKREYGKREIKQNICGIILDGIYSDNIIPKNILDDSSRFVHKKHPTYSMLDIHSYAIRLLSVCVREKLVDKRILKPEIRIIESINGIVEIPVYMKDS